MSSYHSDMTNRREEPTSEVRVERVLQVNGTFVTIDRQHRTGLDRFQIEAA